MTDFLDRAALLDRTERQYETVTLHDGSQVMVQSLTESEAMRLAMAELSDYGEYSRDRTIDRRVNAMIFQVVDAESQKPMFGQDDREGLRKLNARDARTIYLACQKLNGVGEDEVQEAEGNLDASQDS